MSERTKALWRIWSFIYSVVIGSAVAGIIALVGLVWGVVDVVWSLLTGRNDLSEDSTPATVVYETLHWNLDLYVFALTGAGEFRWVPSW